MTLTLCKFCTTLKPVFTESWLSGLKRLPAKQEVGAIRLKGSNPLLSAIFSCGVNFFIGHVATTKFLLIVRLNGGMAEKRGDGLQNRLRACKSLCRLQFVLIVYLLPAWWNGRHSPLKPEWRKPCQFESGRRDQICISLDKRRFLWEIY